MDMIGIWSSTSPRQLQSPMNKYYLYRRSFYSRKHFKTFYDFYSISCIKIYTLWGKSLKGHTLKYNQRFIYIGLKIKQNCQNQIFELTIFCSSLDGISTHTIDTLQHQSLMSSALDHSATSAIYNIMCKIP